MYKYFSSVHIDSSVKFYLCDQQMHKLMSYQCVSTYKIWPSPTVLTVHGALDVPAAEVAFTTLAFTIGLPWSVFSFPSSWWSSCRCLDLRFRLLGFCGSFWGLIWCLLSCAFLVALCCRVFCATALMWGNSLVMFPTAFVLPSRNTIRMSVFRYSGFLMKRNRTMALSPVLKWSPVIVNIVAVCLTLPTWTENNIEKYDNNVWVSEFS